MFLASLFPWFLFAPREPIRTIDWALVNIHDKYGTPYDDFAFPHQSAPGGPLDALDCRSILEVTLQWAARLGKSFSGYVGALKTADREPCPMMYAGVDRKLAPEIVDQQLYPMLERCPPLAGQLLDKSRRSRLLIKLQYCQLYIAWARSPATLADKGIRFGHAGEIDKWDHLKTSREADPLQLFDERFKEFPTHKKVKESTPALKHSSRVERLRLAGHNCRLEVPCPHCGRYQPLRMGDGRAPGGIVWTHDPSGRTEPELARNTARYICLHCAGEIGDEHRGPMLRLGVWAPEGCGVDDERARRAAEDCRKPGRPLWGGWATSDWITGTPLRDGPNYSSQLSSLYALSLSWGEVAAKAVASAHLPHERRNFVNSWLGETWSLVKHDEDWEQLGERLLAGPNVARRMVPRGYELVAAGIDKQLDHWVVVVVAWGPQGQAHVCDYAEIPFSDGDELLLAYLGQAFPGEDGQPRRIVLGLVDSGNRPHGVHDLVARAKRQRIALLPCKGSSTALGVPYHKRRLGENTARPGAAHVLVDTITTQDWVEKRLHGDGTSPPPRGQTSLFRAAIGEHRSFLEQLLNDAPVERTDNRNQVRESWDRLDATIPNDCRDGLRYAFVAKLLRHRGQEPEQQPQERKSAAKRTSAPKRSRTDSIRRPGGWLSQMP